MNRKSDLGAQSQKVAKKFSEILLKNEIEGRCVIEECYQDDYAHEVMAVVQMVHEDLNYKELLEIIKSPVKSWVFDQTLKSMNLDMNPDQKPALGSLEDQLTLRLLGDEILPVLRQNNLYAMGDEVHTLESFIRSVLRDEGPFRNTAVDTADVYRFFLTADTEKANRVLFEALHRSQLPSAQVHTFEDFVVAKSKEVSCLFNAGLYEEMDGADHSYHMDIGIESKKQRSEGIEVTVSFDLDLKEAYDFFEKKGVLIEGVLDERDWVIWAICNNLYLQGMEYFTVSTVRRILGHTGNSNKRTEQWIAESIDRLSRVQVYRQLTYSLWDTENDTLLEHEHFDKDTHKPFYDLSETEKALILKKGEYEWRFLLPVTGGSAVKINGQYVSTGYRMTEMSALFSIALEHSHRFNLPAECLKVLKSNRGNTMRLRVYKYLVTQISMPDRECKYLFESLCTACGLTERYQKTRGFQVACEILDILKANKVIHSYEIAPRGRDMYIYLSYQQRYNYKHKGRSKKRTQKKTKSKTV